MTMSGRSATTSRQSVDAFSNPKRSRIRSKSSGLRRLTMTYSTSSRRRSIAGRCELTVHEPAPMTPRGSFVTAAPRLALGALGARVRGRSFFPRAAPDASLGVVYQRIGDRFLEGHGATLFDPS